MSDQRVPVTLLGTEKNYPMVARRRVVPVAAVVPVFRVARTGTREGPLLYTTLTPKVAQRSERCVIAVQALRRFSQHGASFEVLRTRCVSAA